MSRSASVLYRSLSLGSLYTLDFHVIFKSALLQTFVHSLPLPGWCFCCFLWTARLQAMMPGLSLNSNVDSEIIITINFTYRALIKSRYKVLHREKDEIR